MARLTHQWADILRSDPRVGHLPSKATNQWVTPLRRNEEGYKIITAVSEATSISNWHFRAQANPLGEVFTPILLGYRIRQLPPSHRPPNNPATEGNPARCNEIWANTVGGDQYIQKSCKI